METWWRELRDLDEKQRDVISLPSEGSFLVKGPPGSGKTNLLLLRANYLTRTEHSNLAIIVFNRTLCEFIKSGGERYEFDSGNVFTSHQFFSRLLEESGQTYEEADDFENDRVGRLAAAESATAQIQNPIYDVILLDEAQDYLSGEIELFNRLARDIFLVCDSRQQIYSGDNIAEHLESIVDESYSLDFHYRCGQPICALADGIGSRFSIGYEPILPTCNYNSPVLRPSVEVFPGDLDAQAEEIARRLKLQRRTYPEGLLGVISPRLVDVQYVANRLGGLGLGSELCIQTREDGYQKIQADKPIWVSTVHGAKGLEFRALHFSGADLVKRFRAEQKRLAYTAVTRAKTSLVIYHDGSMPGYLDAALNAVRPRPVDEADLGEAFGNS